MASKRDYYEVLGVTKGASEPSANAARSASSRSFKDGLDSMGIL